MKIFFSLFITISLLASIPAQANEASRQIDALVEAELKRQGISPNEPTSDEQFVRRIYLDILGRIPSLQETRTFMDSTVRGKRSKLIDYLLKQPGYASAQYNMWADILRIKQDRRNEGTSSYVKWVKKAVGENMPYDKFVYELISADGNFWENGAVGYYVRDAGNPLDNMAHTMQIFLGTQVVCAQCHNHPFDKWTQKQYYEMAAYTYSVDTRVRPENVLGIDKILREEDRAKRAGSKTTGSKPKLSKGAEANMKRQQELKDFLKGKDKKDSSGSTMSKMAISKDLTSGNIREALRDLLEPLSFGATETNKKIKLPRDYAYEDAEPGTDVEPHTMFGAEAVPRRGKSLRDAYGAWMTSADNPRFAKVISNRLWKRVMGRGLFEPHDEIKDDTESVNPKLVEFLTQKMKDYKFDLKAFYRMLYNTRTYQRVATNDDIPYGTPYYFQGPMLRRMSAEQLWDSFLTLTIPQPDERTYTDSRNSKRQRELEMQAKKLMAMDPNDIVKLGKQIATVQVAFDKKSESLRAQIAQAAQAKDNKRSNQLRKELRTADREAKKQIAEIKKAALGASEAENEMMMMEAKGKGKKAPKSPLAIPDGKVTTRVWCAHRNSRSPHLRGTFSASSDSPTVRPSKMQMKIPLPRRPSRS